MHGKGLRRHGPLGIDIMVIGAARGHMADQFDSADFNDAVAFAGFKAGGFGVQNDFAHVLSRQLADQFLHGGAGAVQRQRLDHMIGARAFFGVGHLALQDLVQML